ncbi:MAG: DLW-39 family protein [Mycobacteriales bacterium]
MSKRIVMGAGRLRYGRCHDGNERERAMAKRRNLLMLITAVGGMLAARKAKARKDEQALWAEATASLNDTA